MFSGVGGVRYFSVCVFSFTTCVCINSARAGRHLQVIIPETPEARNPQLRIPSETRTQHPGVTEFTPGGAVVGRPGWECTQPRRPGDGGRTLSNPNGVQV